LPAATIADASAHFDTKLWTGTGSARSITMDNSSMSPDFVWIKARSASYNHYLYDTIRGATKELYSNTYGPEQTDADNLTSFDSNGFSLGPDAGVNQSAKTYVGWVWNAGTSSPASNTDGSITSTVKANQTAGFSIVSWTGTGSLATVGHGLNAVPEFMAVKNRNSSGNTNWCVYHVGLTSAQYTLGFDSSYFEDPNDPTWGSTAPTNSVFTVKTRASANESGKNMIGYIFTPVSGFSSFGKYTANGSSDGPYVHTGFAVAWLLTKRINSSGSWEIHDLRRPGYNPQDGRLFPDSTAQDGSGNDVDLLSNGFKIRNSFSGMNGSNNDTYVYAAFASNPFSANGGLAR
jgi:hypothetical protein